MVGGAVWLVVLGGKLSQGNLSSPSATHSELYA